MFYIWGYFYQFFLPVSNNKCCQSCGLPWDKDPNGGGTNEDGSKSEDYCSYCFEKGRFVQPDWKVTDMQAYAVKILAKKGVPEFLGKMLTKGIPDLKRWKQ
jgi:hypothetical protein